MQCSVHPGQEAIDVCRRCGKPLCAQCGEDSEGRFVCARCQVEGSGPRPASVAHVQSPAVAAALSAALPGLGQAANGQALSSVALISVGILLVRGIMAGSEVLGVFLAILWIYQVYEAYHTARARQAASAAAAGGEGDGAAAAETRGAAGSSLDTQTSYVLVAAGLVLLVENLTSFLSARANVALPLAVILTGVLLLLSYFRSGEGTAP